MSDTPKKKSISDPVTHDEMQRELRRLRSAVAVLANCLGAHLIDVRTGRELTELLKEPSDR